MDTARRSPVIPLLAALALVALTALAIGRGLRARGTESAPVAEADPQPQAAVSAPVGAPAGADTSYTVVPGDTLSVIAARFGTTIEGLMTANGLRDPDAIYVGQELRLGIEPDRDGPPTRTVPDSELVYGPAYLDFDTADFLAGQAGPLSRHLETVDGEELTGPEIVDRVAREFSVGPRALLAFVESRSGWVTGAPSPDVSSPADYPAGLEDPIRSGLWLQLNWLADRLNGGYYDWKTRDNRLLTTADGAYLRGHSALGPGSFAVQRALALQSTEAQLPARLAAFDAAYRALFGDPWAREIGTPVPGRITFPALTLPWSEGESWWMTGGPHGGWGDGSAWSALDFVPDDDMHGCYVSDAFVTAAADGVLIDGGDGQLWLDLDGDGRRETGPAVFYLHLAADGRAQGGTAVRAGDPIGHPSCEGGVSNATHVHIGRTYDGEWLAAAGADPMVLGGWSAYGAPHNYDGGLIHDDGREREACECRLEDYNDVRW